jgi:hypothetical protein
MNIYQQGFKSDLLNTIFKLSGNLWLKVTGAYTMQYIIILIMGVITLASLGIFNNITSLGSMDNPQEIMRFYQDLFESFTITPKFIVLLFVMIMVGGVLISWFYNFSFLLADTQIKSGKSDFGQIFQESMSKDVFNIFGVMFLLYLFSIAAMVLVMASAAVSGWITFLLVIAFFVFMNKFFLVLPAFITGKMSLINAFNYSFKHMTINRCFKLFGVMILIFIVLIVVAVIIGLIAGAFSLIPIVGPVFQIIIQILLGGFIAALSVVALIGLYYRYAPEIGSDENIEVDDLLVSE